MPPSIATNTTRIRWFVVILTLLVSFKFPMQACNGIMVFQPMATQVESNRSRNETLEQARSRLANAARRFGNGARFAERIASIEESESWAELQTALEPMTRLRTSVNPESRVKIVATRDRIKLVRGTPSRFFVRVENIAGITAPLELNAFDVAQDPPAKADWVDVRIVDSPFTSKFLSGAEREWKVVELLSRRSGLNEVRLSANAGQGTQDLGFRATADIILDTKDNARIDNGEPK